MKIAGVQLDVAMGEVDANLNRVCEHIKLAAANEARLVVFPECSLSGYCFESIDEAAPFAQPLPGPATSSIHEVCQECQIAAVVGMLERSADHLFNSAVLIGPQGVIDTYRKVHLPYLGIDRLTTPGDRPFSVATAIDDLRVGMNICYDASFPEASRSLMLQGADLIALPTNWPPGAECVAQHTIHCRALENRVFFIAVNRVGTERGFSFIGKSQICDPNGACLHLASEYEEEIFYVDIDVTEARRKHIVHVPGLHEVHRTADRRPEMYSELTEPHRLKSLRDDR